MKPVDVGINGDCKLASKELLQRLQNCSGIASAGNTNERLSKLKKVRATWEAKLNDMTNDQTNAKEGRCMLTVVNLLRF